MNAQMSRVLAGATLTWKFLSCFVAFFTIDRFGRRALFIFSGFGMGSCMLALAVATSFPTSNLAAQIAAVFFIFMYQFFVPIGFLGANFLYCTEIAPLKLRVAMSSISTANHWLWNFVIIMVTPVAINNIGNYYYILYCVISFCIPVSIYFWYPETMGMGLEEIEGLFRESKGVREVVGVSRRVARERRRNGGKSDEEVVGEKVVVEGEKGKGKGSEGVERAELEMRPRISGEL